MNHVLEYCNESTHCSLLIMAQHYKREKLRSPPESKPIHLTGPEGDHSQPADGPIASCHHQETSNTHFTLFTVMRMWFGSRHCTGHSFVLVNQHCRSHLLRASAGISPKIFFFFHKSLMMCWLSKQMLVVYCMTLRQRWAQENIFTRQK